MPIAGITRALLCKRDGARVALVEAGRVAGGAVGCNTGKVSALRSTIYSTIRSIHGDEAGSIYAQANCAGVGRVAALAAEKDIDCDLNRRPASTYAAEESALSSVEKEADAAHTLLSHSRARSGDVPGGCRSACCAARATTSAFLLGTT